MDIATALPYVFSGIGAIWTAWLTFRTKRIDNDQKASDKSFDIERERIKAEFERAKDFQDDLMNECKALRDECRSLRDQVSKANDQVLQQAATITEKNRAIAELERKVDRMTLEIKQLKKQIEEMEAKQLRATS